MMLRNVTGWVYVAMSAILLVVVSCSGCSNESGDVGIETGDSKRMSAIELANAEFMRLQLGRIADYDVEDLSEDEDDYWLIFFSLKDKSLAEPGSDVSIAIDKKSREAAVISD